MDAKRLQARSRVLAILVGIVFAVLAFVLLVEGAAVGWRGYPAVVLVQRVSMLFYLGAIWMVRQAFVAIARGALFDHVVPRLLGRVGWALFLGAMANVFFVPAILRTVWLRGSFAHFDPAAITLGVVGLTLVLVARLLVQAAEMRAELDEIV